MREIKFKAYVKEIQKVCDVISIDFLNRDVLVIIDETRANQKVYKLDEVEILQYTGFEDINENEIYDNDIVVCKII